MRDLGIIAITTYTPSDTASQSIQKAWRMLFYLKRAFLQFVVPTFLLLHATFVRPHLDYALVACNPYLKRDIKRIERVQRLAFRMIKGFKNLSYEETLVKLDSFSLERRRLHGDLICAYRISRGEIDISWSDLFLHPPRLGLRSDSQFKIFQQHALNRRRHSAFAVRVAPFWNKFQSELHNAPSVTVFNNGINKSWSTTFPDYAWIWPAPASTNVPFSWLFLFVLPTHLPPTDRIQWSCTASKANKNDLIWNEDDYVWTDACEKSIRNTVCSMTHFCWEHQGEISLTKLKLVSFSILVGAVEPLY